MKKTIFFITTILTIFYSINLRSQDRVWGNHHCYITRTAWDLVTLQYPSLLTSPMNQRIGSVSNPAFGTVVRGSTIEDDIEIIYDWNWPCDEYTASHFWEVDDGDDGTFTICGFPNALRKAKVYWTGLKPIDDKSKIRLENKSDYTPIFKIGPLQLNDCSDAMIYISYNNLADAIHNRNNIIADSRYGCQINGEYLNTPLVEYLLTHSSYSIQQIYSMIDDVLYELLGRICHLIEDMSSPAHAHEDVHDASDYYEEEFLKNVYESATKYTALERGGLMNINYIQNPLRTIIYTMNQIADRFPSNDEDGDLTCPNSLVDNFFIHRKVSPIYSSTTGTPTIHTGDPSISWLQRYAIADSTFKHSFNGAIRAVAGFLYYVHCNTSPNYNSPQIKSVTQNPPLFWSSTEGAIVCELYPEGDFPDVVYTWYPFNIPPGVTLVQPEGPNKNWIQVKTPPLDKFTVPTGENGYPFTLYVSAQNNNGSVLSALYTVKYVRGIPGGGCPWVLVTQQDTNFTMDNNILNKSQLPENQGNFITDKYILKTKPGIFDNKIKLDIVETSIDSTLINSIKLYAIQHPLGTKLGITANNEIVYYDSASVIQNDIASLYDSDYGYTDITSDLQFHNPIKGNSFAQGDSLYHIFAEYKNQDIINPAIITFMKRGILDPITPIAKDNFSGNLFVNTPVGTSQFPFMRRENPDDVILPLTGKNLLGSVDSIHIAWDKSFKIDYAAIASLNYSGFSVSELPLVTAFHTSDGDVLQNLLYLDSGYSYVSPNTYLNLEFSISPSMVPQVKTDYVLEINGQVIFLGSNKMRSTKVTNPNQNTIPDKYSLSQNYPNPFNPVTKINFSIPKQGFVTLKIYDLLGREIRTLVNETKQPGNYSVDFNGSSLASGVYFYRLESNSFTSIKRMVLIK